MQRPLQRLHIDRLTLILINLPINETERVVLIMSLLLQCRISDIFNDNPHIFMFNLVSENYTNTIIIENFPYNL